MTEDGYEFGNNDLVGDYFCQGDVILANGYQMSYETNKESCSVEDNVKNYGKRKFDIDQSSNCDELSINNNLSSIKQHQANYYLYENEINQINQQEYSGSYKNHDISNPNIPLIHDQYQINKKNECSDSINLTISDVNSHKELDFDNKELNSKEFDDKLYDKKLNFKELHKEESDSKESDNENFVGEDLDKKEEINGSKSNDKMQNSKEFDDKELDNENLFDKELDDEELNNKEEEFDDKELDNQELVDQKIDNKEFGSNEFDINLTNSDSSIDNSDSVYRKRTVNTSDESKDNDSDTSESSESDDKDENTDKKVSTNLVNPIKSNKIKKSPKNLPNTQNTQNKSNLNKISKSGFKKSPEQNLDLQVNGKIKKQKRMKLEDLMANSLKFQFKRNYLSKASPATLGTFRLPDIKNEPMRNYPPGSEDRAKLQAALKEFKNKAPIEIPVFVNGKEIYTNKIIEQRNPSEHATIIAKFHEADSTIVEQAIKGALDIKPIWESFPLADRSAIFLKAADLAATKYRYKLLAATMLGQGKNTWQAEIDAAAETIDFWRFNVKYAHQMYQQQPTENSPGVWNRVEYRPLEGFVYAITPFNFTAIAGNLTGAPALLGNVVLHKPSASSVLSNWVIMEIFREAGLPDGVIQFIPGPAQEITDQILKSPDFASLHFTGSTTVFRKLWKDIGNNIENYKSYPRIVGETGGKNFHVIHESANVTNAVNQTIRGAFEYQGQKCSACSRAYVPDSLWEKFRNELLKEHAKIKIGPTLAILWAQSYNSPFFSNSNSFAKIKSYIEWVKEDGDSEIIAGGNYDDSKGYFVSPTIVVTKNPKSKTIVEEIFGYKADEFDQIIDIANDSVYALTGSIFAQERSAVLLAHNKLRHASGNFYINDKCTGAIVGQQPFGENFLDIEEFTYPSNLV
ncbi:7716_t:CDS:10 [Diversispora eburnea]|uniref:L-glutamate gamma-semialdehyde dehydrogenase n=1 Tax=Diversispora eburnea TaxID=1213867 RepID=A0A9N9FVS3_9GLOM|nr:7716_t:CDS:10 [Diversispora eburnea]